MGTKVTSEAAFEADVLNSDKPVVVDFFTTWCGPCKMIAPALEELADEMSDRVSIVKIDADEHLDVATKYGVRGFPTLILFKDGAVAQTQPGAMPKSQIKAWIERGL
ncbi:thioredoxin [Nostoc sp. 3335mG]|jgi:thioredoxin 1|nr:thioredoxin [Nostoc sp. 3335mG]